MNLLELRDVATGYGPSQVLFGVDLEVPQGAVVTLLGRNGMGKTTTLRSIFGLLALRNGEIRFAARRIDAMTTDAIARLGLAIVPEGRQVFPNLSVAEHLIAFARPSITKAPATPEWTAARIFELFPQLAARRAALGNQLSGGEQQMLAIGRALTTNPRLLVLDDATEGLAPLVREEIWRCLALLKERRAVNPRGRQVRAASGADRGPAHDPRARPRGLARDFGAARGRSRHLASIPRRLGQRLECRKLRQPWKEEIACCS